MSKSTYLENVVLDLVLGGVAWAPPSIIYVALSSAVFDENATGSAFNEITASGAARVAVANNLTNWPAAVNGIKNVGVTVTFPAATGTWPEARAFYLLDAMTLGNILHGGNLVTPRTLQAGDTASFGPYALTITED